MHGYITDMSRIRSSINRREARSHGEHDQAARQQAHLSLRSGLSVHKLKLYLTSSQPFEDVAAVINGRAVELEVHLELRQGGAQSTAFLPSQKTMKAVERP